MAVRDYSEVVEFKSKFGFESSELKQILTMAINDQVESSKASHPATVAGISFWGNVIALLSDVLCLPGSEWSRIDFKNLPILYSESFRIAILTQSGDENVGSRSQTPKLKRSPGTTALRILHANSKQRSIFENHTSDSGMSSKIFNIENYEVWSILHHAHRIKATNSVERLCYELSMLVPCDEGTDVAERILFEDIVFEIAHDLPGIDPMDTHSIDIEENDESDEV